MKTTTDIHWNERAKSVADDIEVNIMDVFQRELEYDLIGPFLDAGTRILEVGCGNGFSTERFRKLVGHVDAFDYAEQMVERARERVGETNNRFIHDNLLEPTSLEGPYDAVVCVRVLINLADFAQQVQALDVMSSLVKPGGKLILAEGFTEGFDALSALRTSVGLSPVQPAAINYYAALSDFEAEIERDFEVVDRFHLGTYDYLTRVVYPLAAGETEVRHNSVMSERFSELARHSNVDDFEHLSRIRGLVCRRRD